ncbi:POU domain, class 3, transcription factor 3-like [Octopus sinensis]|uniref:POU domain, class 3, transcription factor 3-like n=1 Tax=Octopus sinensis TaxID=2607531 RepID=A0A7E6EJA9_9MOLL|nr:POU domain, class 3, transcription factor 3-like [Octopus sinensis]
MTSPERRKGPNFYNPCDHNNQNPFQTINKPTKNLKSTECMFKSANFEPFIKYFKQERIKLGYTQSDISQLMEEKGISISQTTVCRFESNQLSFSTQNKLINIFRKWLLSLRSSDQKTALIYSFEEIKKRKKRTSFDCAEKTFLENWFREDQRPSPRSLTDIAELLSIEEDVVRIWFCNRRQRLKKYHI